MIRTLIILSIAVLIIGACAQGPRHVEIGIEECAHCRMIASDARFFAQLRTEQGRSYVFDSIECMAEFVQSAETTARALWVADFNAPDTWLPVEAAHFLRSETLRSPMGMNLSAYETETAAHAHRAESGGHVMAWADVLEAVRSRGVTQEYRDHAH
jgi:copper chaperone NosL